MFCETLKHINEAGSRLFSWSLGGRKGNTLAATSVLWTYFLFSFLKPQFVCFGMGAMVFPLELFG